MNEHSSPLKEDVGIKAVHPITYFGIFILLPLLKTVVNDLIIAPFEGERPNDIPFKDETFKDETLKDKTLKDGKFDSRACVIE